MTIKLAAVLLFRLSQYPSNLDEEIFHAEQAILQLEDNRK